MLINFKRGFTHIDEFTFWGSSVEENVRLGKMYVVNESNLIANKE